VLYRDHTKKRGAVGGKFSDQRRKRRSGRIWKKTHYPLNHFTTSRSWPRSPLDTVAHRHEEGKKREELASAIPRWGNLLQLLETHKKTRPPRQRKRRASWGKPCRALVRGEEKRHAIRRAKWIIPITLFQKTLPLDKSKRGKEGALCTDLEQVWQRLSIENKKKGKKRIASATERHCGMLLLKGGPARFGSVREREKRGGMNPSSKLSNLPRREGEDKAEPASNQKGRRFLCECRPSTV